MIMQAQDEKLRNLIAEQAAEWHVAHEGGGLDPEQARAFMRWLRSSPLHLAEYLTISGIARDAADAARASDASLDDLMAEKNDPVRLLETADVNTPHELGAGKCSRRMRRRWRFRFAAVATVLAVVVAVWAALWFPSASQGERFATRHGEGRNLQLSDNTLVQLDSNSEIEVNFDGHRRSITLERGQAYFRVAVDAARPFSVRVGHALIRDIGTSFDVYQHMDGTTITVAEGRVQVWNSPRPDSSAIRRLLRVGASSVPSGQPVATLDAGEQARLDTAGQLEFKGVADLQQTLAWTQGNITFDNRPIAEVAAEFNRYNNTYIRIDDAQIGALRISGTFNAHDVAAFTAFLTSMPGVRVEQHDRKILVIASRDGRDRHD